MFVTEMPTNKNQNKKKRSSFPERRTPSKSVAFVSNGRKTEEEPSKWNEYMEEETEKDLDIRETLSNYRRGFLNDRKLEETSGRDFKVDDEVHPDFI